jgi:DNA-binding transcriptional ArsR family regulator
LQDEQLDVRRATLPPFAWVTKEFVRDHMRSLSTGAIATFLCLSYHADRVRECWPSLSKLCEEIGLDRKSVMRAISELEEKGFIEVGRRNGAGNRYKLFDQPVPKTPLVEKVVPVEKAALGGGESGTGTSTGISTLTRLNEQDSKTNTPRECLSQSVEDAIDWRSKEDTVRVMIMQAGAKKDPPVSKAEVDIAMQYLRDKGQGDKCRVKGYVEAVVYGNRETPTVNRNGSEPEPKIEYATAPDDYDHGGFYAIKPKP